MTFLVCKLCHSRKLKHSQHIAQKPLNVQCDHETHYQRNAIKYMYGLHTFTVIDEGKNIYYVYTY